MKTKQKASRKFFLYAFGVLLVAYLVLGIQGLAVGAETQAEETSFEEVTPVEEPSDESPDPAPPEDGNGGQAETPETPVSIQEDEEAAETEETFAFQYSLAPLGPEDVQAAVDAYLESPKEYPLPLWQEAINDAWVPEDWEQYFEDGEYPWFSLRMLEAEPEMQAVGIQQASAETEIHVTSQQELEDAFGDLVSGGTIYLDSSFTVDHTMDFPYKTFTLNGQSNTIFAPEGIRHFIVNAYGNYLWTLEDITFQGPHSSAPGENYSSRAMGGGIDFNGGGTRPTIVMNGVTFTGCQDGIGGALYATNVNITLNDCEFYNNGASHGYGGGGYYHNNCNLTVNGGSFHHNGAPAGGAMSALSGTVKVTDVAFEENYAREGGAYTDSSGSSPNQTFTGCTFTGNYASKDGGAMWINGFITYNSCVFTGNEAEERGGADFVTSDSVYNGCEYYNNTAVYGGAIYGNQGNGGKKMFSGCRFEGNTAYNGGAIYGHIYQYDIRDSVFEGNYASNGLSWWDETSLKDFPAFYIDQSETQTDLYANTSGNTWDQNTNSILNNYDFYYLHYVYFLYEPEAEWTGRTNTNNQFGINTSSKTWAGMWADRGYGITLEGYELLGWRIRTNLVNGWGTVDDIVISTGLDDAEIIARGYTPVSQDSFEINGPLAIQPMWKEVSSEVSINFDKGTTDTVTGMPAATTAQVDTAYTLPTSIPSRSGYTFSGWRYGGSTYRPGVSFTVPNGDVTFTAIWTANPIRYSLTYASGTSDAVSNMPSGTTATSGTRLTLSMLQPSRVGYTFKGWAYGGSTYGPGAPFIMPAGNAQLVAQWEKTPDPVVPPEPDSSSSQSPSSVPPASSSSTASSSSSETLAEVVEPPASVIPQAQEDAEPPVANLEDDTLDTTGIGEEGLPLIGLFSMADHWSLLNLILMLLMVALGVARLLVGRAREAKKWKLACFILGVFSIPVFLLTQDLTKPMGLADVWSLAMVVLLATQVVLAALAQRAAQQSGGHNQE